MVPCLCFVRQPCDQDDFDEIMKEVVPELIEQTLRSEEGDSSSVNRPAADVERSPSDAAEPGSSRARVNEVLNVQDCSSFLAMLEQ